MRRIRRGEEYFVFPGGNIKENEPPEAAATRECREELSLDIIIDKLLFKIENWDRDEFYYLVKNFSGEARLAGPEKERMNENNQYKPVWLKIDDALKLDNFYPEKAKERLRDFLKK